MNAPNSTQIIAESFIREWVPMRPGEGSLLERSGKTAVLATLDQLGRARLSVSHRGVEISPLPPPPPALFRGAKHRHRRGMSWTSNLAYASYHQQRHDGDIWILETPEPLLLIELHKESGEVLDEWLVDATGANVRRAAPHDFLAQFERDGLLVGLGDAKQMASALADAST